MPCLISHQHHRWAPEENAVHEARERLPVLGHGEELLPRALGAPRRKVRAQLVHVPRLQHLRPVRQQRELPRHVCRALVVTKKVGAHEEADEFGRALVLLKPCGHLLAAHAFATPLPLEGRLDGVVEHILQERRAFRSVVRQCLLDGLLQDRPDGLFRDTPAVSRERQEGEVAAVRLGRRAAQGERDHEPLEPDDRLGTFGGSERGVRGVLERAHQVRGQPLGYVELS
mmetsp:Transcript_57193/g.135851  ORF Transcript_57193/g.135851 Transcript_57193/m.135851 type:complete len:228 (+) Transcript_57193:814-1497(+)